MTNSASSRANNNRGRNVTSRAHRARMNNAQLNYARYFWAYYHQYLRLVGAPEAAIRHARNMYNSLG
jgi:hypothetical protein